MSNAAADKEIRGFAGGVRSDADPQRYDLRQTAQAPRERPDNRLFPYSSEVKRFWLSGSGTVDAEYVRSAEQVIRKTDTEKPDMPRVVAGHLEFIELTPRPSDLHFRQVDLKGGGRLEIGFRGNFFDLNREDRELLDLVAELVRGYPESVRIQKKPFDRRQDTARHKAGIWARIRSLFR